MPSFKSIILNMFLKMSFKWGRKPGNTELETMRSLLNQSASTPLPDSVSVDLPIDMPVKGEWVRWIGEKNSETANTVVLYLHGGGYIACSPETHRQLTVAISEKLQNDVFVSNYRLAPENPFPCALEDALEAYKYLISKIGKTGEIIIAGDSAGGGLAASLIVKLGDLNIPRPKAAILFSPWTDLACTGNSLQENDRRCSMFYGDDLRIGALHYTDENNLKNPLCSPYYASMHSFPPVLAFASKHETLRDDATRFIQKLREAGVKAQLELWNGMPHAWPVFYSALPEAEKAITCCAKFIDKLNSERSGQLN